MPRRTRACVGRVSRFLPSNVMPPPAALRSPMTLFITVVLPAPLRPMRPVIEPLGTCSEMPRRICTLAMPTFRFSRLSTAADHVALHLRVGERRVRRRVGDDPAVVEREHALGEAADELHVVLDEEH